MKKKILIEFVVYIIPVSIGLLTNNYLGATPAIMLTWLITNILSHLAAKIYWK